MYRKKTKTDVEKLLVGFEQLATKLLAVEKSVYEYQRTIQQLEHHITYLETSQEHIKDQLEYIKNL